RSVVLGSLRVCKFLGLAEFLLCFCLLTFAVQSLRQTPVSLRIFWHEVHCGTKLRDCAVNISRLQEFAPGISGEPSRLQSIGLLEQLLRLLAFSISSSRIALLAQYRSQRGMCADQIWIERDCLPKNSSGLV